MTQQNQNPFADYPQEMTRFSIVSMSEPGFVMPRDSSISFHPKMLKLADAPDPAVNETRGLVKDVLQQSMQARGLPFSPYVRARGDFWLAYTVVYENTMSDELITRKFGMMPGFINNEATLHEKGTVILDLMDSNKQKTVWRSSVQGLVAPELKQELRRLRLRSAFDQMLSSLPVEAGKR